MTNVCRSVTKINIAFPSPQKVFSGLSMVNYLLFPSYTPSSSLWQLLIHLLSYILPFLECQLRGAWWAQSVKRPAHDLMVMKLSPCWAPHLLWSLLQILSLCPSPNCVSVHACALSLSQEIKIVKK